MKLKSTLWALAFAFAAVSCSDDLENGPGSNENSDGNKSSTYMKVTVNAGVVTRAGESTVPPTGGEDGDGSDVGLVNEYRVTDVTVILYKNLKTGGTSNDTQNDRPFKPTSVIVGAGYATTSGSMGAGDDAEHSKSATVMVKAKEQSESFDGNYYGVITVTNWGSDALKNKVLNTEGFTATNLANLLVTKTHSLEESLNTKFIMSSHKSEGETVQLIANATEETAPSVSVHVERLAAKVRINPTGGVTNYIYTVGEGENETAKVRLDNVVLVNKLTSGSYLLKRVTSDVTTGDDIPTLTANGDEWLGDENAQATNITGGTVYPGTNFVIDPWTRNKTVITTGTTGTTIPTVAAETTTSGQPFMMEGAAPSLTYANRYVDTGTFSTLWASLSGIKALSTSTANANPIIIDYTMENTTSVDASQNGYSTGALFKAVYLPKQWSASTKDDMGKDVVKPVDVDYNGATTEGTGYNAITTTTAGQDFYVYQGNIYQDFAAIFNEFIWEKQSSMPTGETKVYSYEDFTKSKITGIDMETFANSTLYTTTVSDPMAYIPYLRKILKNAEEGGGLTGKKFTADNAIENYLGLTEKKDTYKEEDVYANVKKYEKGVTYYPYWIRHANNGKPTEMGIMEFGIVRNNVYDLTIQEIKGLGLSGMEKPEPDKEDETKDYFFKVIINVKDWVIRNNSGIIFQ